MYRKVYHSSKSQWLTTSLDKITLVEFFHQGFDLILSVKGILDFPCQV